MDRKDQQAIEDLFDRLAEAERRSPPRDAEAETLIRSAVSRQPAAPYYMAQTIVVQQQALESAQQRIEALEQRSGGFLGGLFGTDSRRQNAPRRDYRNEAHAEPWGNRGGGFLAGAAQTAMGVAGGVLLGNMIAGAMFGGFGGGGGSEEALAQDAQSGGGDDGNAGGDNFDVADAGGDIGGDFGGDF